MMYFYIDESQDRINAVCKKPLSPDHLMAVGCTEVTAPDGFVFTVPYVNEDGEDRSRDMTATELLAALSYADKRAVEYPSIGDQLDALYHAGVFPPEMAAAIQAVKNKYPKGQA